VILFSTKLFYRSWHPLEKCGWEKCSSHYFGAGLTKFQKCGYKKHWLAQIFLFGPLAIFGPFPGPL